MLMQCDQTVTNGNPTRFKCIVVFELWHWCDSDSWSALYSEVMLFQQETRGCETLDELMSLPSTSIGAKVTVILNHFHRKTLCAQLDALLHQSHPFYNVWVLAFATPREDHLKSIVETYNDSRIHFVGSSYDFKYYGRFQMALQV